MGSSGEKWLLCRWRWEEICLSSGRSCEGDGGPALELLLGHFVGKEVFETKIGILVVVELDDVEEK